MDPSFWIERWDNRQIGFHQQHVNPYLQAFWPRLDIPSNCTVFVPLCGKSGDMQWLHARGHSVMGVEISRTAIQEFFAEQRIEPAVTRGPRFECWESPGFRLLCGDFFALNIDDCREVQAVFDRAALVALPKEMRRRYAEKMSAVVPHAQTLLVSMTYSQEQMNGPPFSVDEAEVREAFLGRRIEKLRDVDVLAQEDNARFRERGVSRMSEQAYLISSRAQ